MEEVLVFWKVGLDHFSPAHFILNFINRADLLLLPSKVEALSALGVAHGVHHLLFGPLKILKQNSLRLFPSLSRGELLEETC